VILFHGLPGNEQNLDLAQAIRRANWNVLTLHYRGSLGSPGTYSDHRIALQTSVLAWLLSGYGADEGGSSLYLGGERSAHAGIPR
jgi:predicted alpha/beta-fold hydrolase